MKVAYPLRGGIMNDRMRAQLDMITYNTESNYDKVLCKILSEITEISDSTPADWYTEDAEYWQKGLFTGCYNADRKIIYLNSCVLDFIALAGTLYHETGHHILHCADFIEVDKWNKLLDKLIILSDYALWERYKLEPYSMTNIYELFCDIWALVCLQKYKFYAELAICHLIELFDSVGLNLPELIDKIEQHYLGEQSII